jgi:hypothetical protein
MKCLPRRTVFAIGLMLATACGFARERPRSLYDGAGLRFERAQLFKPQERTNLGPAFALAPLIVQEVNGTNPPPAPVQIHFQAGSLQLNGRPLPQMTYWWHYGTARTPERRLPPRRGPEERLRKQGVPDAGRPDMGVRLTLSTNGSPLLYEILQPSNSVMQIYVSQSVEAAARAEFGAALPGRRHAVERALNEAPDVVVPRIVDDPPAVMGPILYLRDGTGAVGTLICRCMDSQARTLVGQGFYELVPGDFSGTVSRATRPEAADPRRLRDDFTNQTHRLSRSLRLPTGF